MGRLKSLVTLAGVTKLLEAFLRTNTQRHTPCLYLYSE